MTDAERARELRVRLDNFITSDGDWDTEQQAEQAITEAFQAVRREVWEEAAGKCIGITSFTDLREEFLAKAKEPSHERHREP